MIFAYPLLRRNVAKNMSLLLIGSSHANKTHRAPPRYKISDFFSSLLEDDMGFSQL
jgi:hypothetical protein